MSFDYCYNYFQQFKALKAQKRCEEEVVETACLQLGFYLASWGMMRNSELQDLSFRGLRPVIKEIAIADEKMWTIDVDNYSPDQIKLVCDVGESIGKKFPFKNQKASQNLITKTMLGVYGCVPAFDTYFVRGSKLGHFGLESLQQIQEFYLENKVVIDDSCRNTLDSKSGKETEILYSKAKIVDMIFFVEGMKERPKSK